MSAAAATPPRVGAGGFTGSDITAWCETCQDHAVLSDRGRCVWCDTPVKQSASTAARRSRRYRMRHGGYRSPLKVKTMTEQQILAAHRWYLANDVSILDVALREYRHGYHGYRTASDLCHALRHAWRSRGLELRTQSEALRIRHARARAAA